MGGEGVFEGCVGVRLPWLLPPTASEDFCWVTCWPVTRRLALQPHMPLLSIYALALEQDLEFGHGMVQAVGTLQTQTFMQVGCTP